MPMLYWNTTEGYAPGEHPNARLWWRPELKAYESANNSLSEFTEYVEDLKFRVAEGGYILSAARGATMAVLSLIPHLKGVHTDEFWKSLKYALDIAVPYWQSTRDLLYPSQNVGIAPSYLFTALFYRTLLDDALDGDFSISDWKEKARFLLSYCPVNERKNNMVWNNPIYANIGWPAPITENYMVMANSGTGRPDLLSLLCLLGKHDHCAALIEVGYDLKDFMIYCFQPYYWDLDLPTSPLVSHIVRYSDRVKANQTELEVLPPVPGDLSRPVLPQQNSFLDAHLSQNDKQGLNWMYCLTEEGCEDADIALQLDAATHYFLTFTIGLDLNNYADLGGSSNSGDGDDDSA